MLSLEKWMLCICVPFKIYTLNCGSDPCSLQVFSLLSALKHSQPLLTDKHPIFRSMSFTQTFVFLVWYWNTVTIFMHILWIHCAMQANGRKKWTMAEKICAQFSILSFILCYFFRDTNNEKQKKLQQQQWRAVQFLKFSNSNSAKSQSVQSFVFSFFTHQN